MELLPQSIRPFIGAKSYDLSRQFYRDLGFKEIITSPKMSYFTLGKLGFYLQDYYIKDWIDNTMIFIEIDDLEALHSQYKSLNLRSRHATVRAAIYRKPIGDVNSSYTTHLEFFGILALLQ